MRALNRPRAANSTISVRCRSRYGSATILTRSYPPRCGSGGLGVKVGDDSFDPAVFVGVGVEGELGEDGVDVGFHGTYAQVQPGGDTGVGQPFGHQRQHSAFPFGQDRQRVLGAGGAADKLRDDGRIHGGTTSGDAAYRVEEVVDLQDPVLEEIAQPGGAGLEQVHRGGGLDVLGQQDRRGLWQAPADLTDGHDAVVGVVGRHAHVGDDELRRVRTGGANELGSGADRRGDLVTVVGEDAYQALPKQDGVVGDYDPHGSTATSRVPDPGELSTVSVPPWASTRSARLRSPSPFRAAPPGPSSLTRATSWPSTVDT